MPIAKCDISTGVYSITNLLNGNRYIGSAARSFQIRWWSHLSSLRRGVHDNRHLQAAWSKYGEKAFSFDVLERCQPGLCLIREQYYLDLYKPFGDNGYNLSPSASSVRGVKFSDESRKRMSDSQRGLKKHTDESKKKLALAASKSNLRPETLILRSLKAKERAKTDEGRKQILDAAKKSLGSRTPESHKKQADKIRGVKQTAERIEKRTAKLRGKKLTDEHKLKLSMAQRGRPLPEKHKEALRKAWIGRKAKGLLPPNTTGYKASEELRQRLSTIRKNYWARKKENEKSVCCSR